MVWIGAEKNGGKFVHSEDNGKDLKVDWYDGQPDNFGSNGKLIFVRCMIKYGPYKKFFKKIVLN